MRQMAGLMLKNNVRQHWATLHAEVRLYVREGLLGSVGDALPFIRTTASSCISTIVAAADLGDWPTLLPTLAQLLESSDELQVAGAMSCLSKICEDAHAKLAAAAGRRRRSTTSSPSFCSSSATPRQSSASRSRRRRRRRRSRRADAAQFGAPRRAHSDARPATTRLTGARLPQPLRRADAAAARPTHGHVHERALRRRDRRVARRAQARVRGDGDAARRRSRAPRAADAERDHVHAPVDAGRRRDRGARGVRVLVGDLRDGGGDGARGRAPPAHAGAAQRHGVLGGRHHDTAGRRRRRGRRG